MILISKDKFDLNHKHIYWNLYLFSRIIQAPTFFLERELSPSQIENHLKRLTSQIDAFNREKIERNSQKRTSLLQSVLAGIQNLPKKNEPNSIQSKIL